MFRSAHFWRTHLVGKALPQGSPSCQARYRCEANGSKALSPTGAISSKEACGKIIEIDSFAIAVYRCQFCIMISITDKMNSLC